MLADTGPDDAVLARVLDFLPTITTPEGGVPFVLETVADAPRAPWWNTDPDPPATLNPTASITGLLYKFGVTYPWLKTATGYVWAQLEVLRDSDLHTLLSVLMFLEAVPERERAERTLERLADEILRHTTLETDAEGYPSCAANTTRC